MRACVVWNPRAGRGSVTRRSLEGAVDRLRAAGWQVETVETRAPGDGSSLARCAAENGCQMVVAAGGDGTVNEVLNGLVGTKAVLGVLPLGTTNVWAREVGIPLNPSQAAALLLDGEPHPIDVGVAGERHFLLMAGVGFDGEVMRTVEPEAKRRMGILAYLVVGAWAVLRFRGTRADITLGDQRLGRRHVQLMVLGNTRRYAFVELTSQARADDGLLDICIFTGREGLLTRVRHFVAVLLRLHVRAPEVEYHRASHVAVWTREPLPVQVDGEYIGNTPMSFGVIPHAVSVMLPHKRPSGLFGEDPPPAVPPLHG